MVGLTGETSEAMPACSRYSPLRESESESASVLDSPAVILGSRLLQALPESLTIRQFLRKTLELISDLITWLSQSKFRRAFYTSNLRISAASSALFNLSFLFWRESIDDQGGGVVIHGRKNCFFRV